MTRILLTFTGFHDPFGDTAVEGDQQTGPILTIVSERSFDYIYLFSTPTVAQRSSDTKDVICARHPGVEVTILDVPLKDPTNHLGILRQIRKHFRKISKAHDDPAYAIAISSGTPHMHACWVLLAASGEIPATILQSIPPKFVPEGKSLVREIDLMQSDFPHITQRISDDHSEENQDERITAACHAAGIIGEDPGFLDVLREASIIAEYGEHVLLLGETGTGKEHFAKFIHHLSPRSTKPLVPVNCSAIPEKLVESQLFGHKKGAFTGALANQEGHFARAHGGILFLDEIGDLPADAQAKLLRAVEQGEIEPVGGNKAVKVDVQVVAATHRDLRAMVSEGTFREDLYQRFGSTIRIPALRQRKADISRLAMHLLEKWNARHKKQCRLSTNALEELGRYEWPGNVRELRNLIHQSAMHCGATVIKPSGLKFDRYSRPDNIGCLPEPAEGFELTQFLDEAREQLVQRALEKSKGVKATAARLLGWSPQALGQYLKRSASDKQK
ncbi:MAG: sigma 54-interacting transcriptional regulator [Verrucomicrobiae bacterium]|nr:sigma 54-interacting transcriptional regulator [Verrucomicrobiae bacterium]